MYLLDQAHYLLSEAGTFLVISHEPAKLRESGQLDECAPQILRCAQDDTTPSCHPERSEGSVAQIRPAELTQVALPTSGESPGMILLTKQQITRYS